MKTSHQTILLTASNVIAKLLSMFFFVVLARILIPEDYGLFRYIMSIAMMIAIAISGFPVALTKFISQHKTQNNEINKYYTNTIFISLIIFALATIGIFIFGNNKLILWLFFLCICVDAFYTGIIKGFYDFKKILSYKLLANLIQIILVLIAYFFLHISFFMFVLLYSISGLLIAILIELIHKSELKIEPKTISKETIKTIINFTIPVMLGSIGYDIMFNIDSILIKYFSGTEQVAYYSIARTILQAYSFLPMAITTIILPKASFIFHNKKDELPKLKQNLNKALFATLGISLLIYIGFAIFGKWLIKLLFTETYLVSYIPLLILGVAQLLFFNIFSTFKIVSSLG